VKVTKNLVLDLEMAQDLEQLAIARHESMSMLVREALRPFLAKQKVRASN
jgi:predicted transcriptional regulator